MKMILHAVEISELSNQTITLVLGFMTPSEIAKSVCEAEEKGFVKFKDMLRFYPTLTDKGRRYLYGDPVIGEVERFVKDRKLDQMPFDMLDFVANIVEELFELDGRVVTKENRSSLKYDILMAFRFYVDPKYPVKTQLTNRDIVDAITDIRVFCIDATMKLGYDPTCTLAEVAKEINSREGEIIDGKFQKHTTPEAKAKWYKADFTRCMS